MLEFVVDKESPGVIFAYFGPDNLLPMTSIIATAVGFFMMFGRRSLRFLGSFLVFRRERVSPASAIRRPHAPAQSPSESPSEPAA